MQKQRMYLRIAGISLAVISGITVAGPAQAAKGGSTCPDDLRTEAGTCAAPIDAAPLTAANKQERADKEAAVAAFREHEKQHAAAQKANGGTVTPYVIPPDDQSGSDYRIPAVVNMTIWKEGQGNGKKSYTCGPAATRNVVNAMNMDRYGEYRDLGEAQWATWEGTTTDGTAVGNIAAAMNNHLSYGSWVAYKATDKDDYLAHVAVNTYQYHQSVIANVDTEELSFFDNHALNHFDFDYGWDSRDSTARWIYIGEEWDPIYIYGSSSYGNPYGKHKESLANSFRAEDKTSFHKLVV
jgi:hypothetical protein